MSQTNPRIVLTGASGFIGSAILRRAVEKGWPTPVILLRAGSDPSRIQDLLTRCEICRLDEGTPGAELARLKALDPSVWIHAGWQGVFGEERRGDSQVTTNLTSLVNALQTAKAAGCTHWIGLGSQAEYGNHNGRISEDTPTVPDTVYGMAKLAASWAAKAFAEANGMCYSWLRIFSTYGPGDDPRWLIPYVIRSLSSGESPKLTACDQIWDYLYVEDAAEAVLSVAATRARGTFNVASGTGVLLKDVVTRVAEAVSPAARVSFGAIAKSPGKAFHLEGDITRITGATGWKPSVPLETGLARTVDYFRDAL